MTTIGEDEQLKMLLQSIAKNHEISSDELQFLLLRREKGQVDFLLIDIREMYEYSAVSIKGTDLLLPTSMIHHHLDELAKQKDRLMIFYCRSANRTFQLISILKRMGYSRIAHLDGGVVEYLGEKVKNAPLPNTLK